MRLCTGSGVIDCGLNLISRLNNCLDIEKLAFSRLFQPEIDVKHIETASECIKNQFSRQNHIFLR